MYVLLFNNVAWLFMCVLLVAMGESLFSVVGACMQVMRDIMGYIFFCRAVSRIYASIYVFV